MEQLKEQLRKAAKIKKFPERHIEILGIIYQALKAPGIRPILVGGAAVEFYTRGGYTTGDIDLVAPSSRELAETMRGLGFVKRGKDWINDSLDIQVEFWSDELGPDEEFNEIVYKEHKLRIISIEDLIVDRLCAFKWWGATADGVNVLLLLNSDMGFDDKTTVRKAKREDVYDGLQGIKRILKLLRDGKVDKAKAMELLTDLHGSFVR